MDDDPVALVVPDDGVNVAVIDQSPQFHREEVFLQWQLYSLHFVICEERKRSDSDNIFNSKGGNCVQAIPQ